MSYILNLSAEEVEARLLRLPSLYTLCNNCEETTINGVSFIKLRVEYDIHSGTGISFKAPCDCASVKGLRVLYGNTGVPSVLDFKFTDANKTDLGDLDNLFKQDAIVNVILDLDQTEPKAFVQNADTNAYLESRFTELRDYVDNHVPDVSVTVDNTYNPYSENAQSGKAVASAIDKAISDALSSLGDITTGQGNAVSEVIEEGIGCDWLYKKWSSGKCELSTSYTVPSDNTGTVTLTVPFMVKNVIPFVVATDGDVSFFKQVNCVNDPIQKTMSITVSFDPGSIRSFAVKLEGLWI